MTNTKRLQTNISTNFYLSLYIVMKYSVLQEKPLTICCNGFYNYGTQLYNFYKS